MKEFFRVFAFLYTCVYVLFMFPGLLFLWNTIIGLMGGAGMAVLLIALTANLIFLWALSGLERRVRDLEDMHQEKDDEWIKQDDEQD